MEVHFTPEVQAKLEQMARDTGSQSDELVKNVVTDFFDGLATARQTRSTGVTTPWRAAGDLGGCDILQKLHEHD